MESKSKIMGTNLESNLGKRKTRSSSDGGGGEGPACPWRGVDIAHEKAARNYTKQWTGARARNDGKQDCNAQIIVRSGRRSVSYAGETGHGGHAEMNALLLWLRAVNPNIVRNSLVNGNVSCSCPSKSCCGRCTSVLATLGVKPASGTTYSKTPMGSTQWSLGLELRGLLARLFGCKPTRIEGIVEEISEWTAKKPKKKRK